MIIGIQFLRFLAASLVVLTHTLGEYDDLRSFGGFGVDVFFVISGFVIYLITDSGHKNFFVKRLIRIVPIYWLFTIGISIIALLEPQLLRSASFDVTQIIASLFFIPYWTENAGFAPILTLGWTLNFEMLFYLFFFISLKISHKYRALITSILILLMVASLKFFNFYGEFSALKFYSSTIWFEFIFGMLIGWFYQNGRIYTLNSVSFTVLSITSLCGMAYLQLNELDTVPRFVQFGLPSFVLVVAFIAYEDTFARLGNGLKRTFLWLGEMSYPVYLIHIYVIGLMHRLLFKEISFLFLLIFTIVSSQIVAHFVNSLFDKPIRRYLNSKLVKFA